MFESLRLMTVREKLARLNWPVLVLVAALAAIGAATLTSVSGGAFSPWAERHTLRCLAGLAIMVACALLPVRLWMMLAVPGYAAALVLLAAVPFVGVEALGAKRWINVSGVSVQPSEIMKVALVLVLARFYAALPPGRASRPQWVAVPLVLIAMPVAFTLRQPDLGTALLFAGLGLGMMFLAGTSVLYYIGGAAGALLALPAMAAKLQDYQRRRIEIFLDPSSDPQGAGYHITQARIALGNGGLSGQGYMQGTQSQLDFVPEKMTDFIFVMIGEEWGFTGAMLVLALFAALIGLLSIMAIRCQSVFGRLLIAGAALSLSIYVVINVAMVTGLVPVVGVPLPLISYGGTAMMTLMVTLGLALSAEVHDGRRGDRF